jgi:hypothetical protein
VPLPTRAFSHRATNPGVVRGAQSCLRSCRMTMIHSTHPHKRSVHAVTVLCSRTNIKMTFAPLWWVRFVEEHCRIYCIILVRNFRTWCLGSDILLFLKLPYSDEMASQPNLAYVLRQSVVDHCLIFIQTLL